MRGSAQSPFENVVKSVALIGMLFVVLGVSYVHAGNLDSVLGNIDSGSTSGGTCRLSSSNTGEKTFTFTSSDELKITALLSTYGDATLMATLKKANGQSVEFMKWHRSGGADSSPLYVQGQAVSESMFLRKGSDYSPKEVTRQLKVSAGDTLTISLTGDIGEGRAFLSVTGKEIENSGSSEGGSSSGGSSGAEGNYESSGGVNLSYSKDWEFEVEGTVTKTHGFARLFEGGGSVHSRKIDGFTKWGNGFMFRLANKKISFTSATVGKVHNPGGTSDHWLDTTVGGVKKGSNVSIKVQYSYTARNVKIYWNGKLVADAGFKIHSMPSDVKSISLTNMSGSVK